MVLMPDAATLAAEKTRIGQLSVSNGDGQTGGFDNDTAERAALETAKAQRGICLFAQSD